MGFPWLVLLTFAFGSLEGGRGECLVFGGKQLVPLQSASSALEWCSQGSSAVVKCKVSRKNRSWSEMEELWMTTVMG